MNENKQEFENEMNRESQPNEAADRVAPLQNEPKPETPEQASSIPFEEALPPQETVRETVDAVAPEAAQQPQTPPVQPTQATYPPPAQQQMPPVYPPQGACCPPPPPPPQAYRWTYADQQAHDAQNERKKRSKGLLLYVMILTGVFAVSFGLLLGVMLMKGREFPTIQFTESETDEKGNVIQSTDRNDAAVIERAKHSVVLIEASSSTSASSGTGIILSSDGYIATNHHVIENATHIRVKFYDGTYATASVRGSSPVDDLAVIKVDRLGLTAATFAKSSECFVGQTVYAIGNPSGYDMAWTTTKGCISYVDRELKIYKDDGTLEKKLKMIQTDAMVNPGNSGGPLINTNGEVIGIVSMKLADGYEGIGFAIPSDGAAEILNAIIRDGHANHVDSNISYDRPVIGITGIYLEAGKHYIFQGDHVSEASDSYAEAHPDEVITPPVSGIYISGVTEGMDAATKLQVGDIITAINGVQADSMNSLMNEINDHYAGDEVLVTYYRNSLYTDVTIILSAQTP